MSSTDEERETSSSDGERKRPSFREYQREKRSRSGDVVSKAATQVHWKVHRISAPPPDPQAPPTPTSQGPPPTSPQQLMRLLPAATAATRPLLGTTEPHKPQHRPTADAGPKPSNSSPLDTIPVRESPARLPISANSAFRPIHPAPAPPPDQPFVYHDLPEPTLQPTTVPPTTVRLPPPQPIFVSAAQIQTHSPMPTPPRPSQKKSSDSAAPVLTSPQLLVAGVPRAVEVAAAGKAAYEEQTQSINLTSPPNSAGLPVPAPRKEEDEKEKTRRESNLDRWRARKKTLEAAKRSQSVDVETHLSSSPGPYPVNSEPRPSPNLARSFLILGSSTLPQKSPSPTHSASPKPTPKIAADFEAKNQSTPSPTRSWHLSPNKLDVREPRREAAAVERPSPARDAYERASRTSEEPSFHPHSQQYAVQQRLALLRAQEERRLKQRRPPPTVIESTYAQEYLTPKAPDTSDGARKVKEDNPPPPPFRPAQAPPSQPQVVTQSHAPSSVFTTPMAPNAPRAQVTSVRVDPYEKILLTSPAGMNRKADEDAKMAPPSTSDAQHPPKQTQPVTRTPATISQEVYQLKSLAKPTHNMDSVVANITMDDFEKVALRTRTSSAKRPASQSLFAITSVPSQRIEGGFLGTQPFRTTSAAAAQTNLTSPIRPLAPFPPLRPAPATLSAGIDIKLPVHTEHQPQLRPPPLQFQSRVQVQPQPQAPSYPVHSMPAPHSTPIYPIHSSPAAPVHSRVEAVFKPPVHPNPPLPPVSVALGSNWSFEAPRKSREERFPLKEERPYDPVVSTLCTASTPFPAHQQAPYAAVQSRVVQPAERRRTLVQALSSSQDSSHGESEQVLDMSAHKTLAELMPGLVLPGQLGRSEDLQSRQATVGLRHVPEDPHPVSVEAPPPPVDREEEEDDEDAYRLSLKDKTAFFEQKIASFKGRRGNRRAQRFQTQPVTQEEVSEALKWRPNPATLHIPSALPKPPGSGAELSSERKVVARIKVSLHTDEEARPETTFAKPAQHPPPPTQPRSFGASRRSGLGRASERSRSLIAPEDVAAAMRMPAAEPEEPPVEVSPLPPALSIAQRVALLKESGRSGGRAAGSGEDGVVGGSIEERLLVLRQSQSEWAARVQEKDAATLTVQARLASAGLATPIAAQTPVRPTRRVMATVKPVQPVQPTPNKTQATPMRLDEGLDSFFSSAAPTAAAAMSPEADFGAIHAVYSQSEKLGAVRKARPPRKNPSSGNPLKTSPPIKQSTPTVVSIHASSGVQTPRRPPANPAPDPTLTPGNRSFALAAEAVEALEAREDWTQPKTLLRKMELSRTPGSVGSAHPPHTERLLVLVKGRRPSLRLLRPALASLNSGDSAFFRSDPGHLFVFHGRFTNVLERAKAKEVGNWVVETRNMGSSASSSPPVIVTEESLLASNTSLPPPLASFLQPRFQADSDTDNSISIPGHDSVADDDIFDELIWANQRVWAVEADGLRPLDEVRGVPLRHELLRPDAVLILDFGAELYVWAGRAATPEKRAQALELGQAEWAAPFPALPGPAIHPLTLRLCPEGTGPLERPDWGIFGVLKDRMESALFRGKFLDWPESKPVFIRQPGEVETPKWSPTHSPPSKKAILALKDPSSVETTPEALGRLLAEKTCVEPSLSLEGESVGRGRFVHKPEDPTMSRWAVATEGVEMWEVQPHGRPPSPVAPARFGQFDADRCYILRWSYRLSVCDRRTLKGEASKAAAETGRTRAAFFYWQGGEARRGEQGACALALRELDSERSPHVRVPQDLEPPAFLNLFEGRMLTLDPAFRDSDWRLFLLRGGPFPSELCMREVHPDPAAHSLRSQGLFILLNAAKGLLYPWIGCESLPQQREMLERIAEEWRSNPPASLGCPPNRLTIKTITEGNEPLAWKGAIELDYPRPTHDFDLRSDGTIRLFQFKSTDGSSGFSASEVVSCWWSGDSAVAFPFEQDDLYGATQPAAFLVDQGSRVWLWEGWVERDEEEEEDPAVVHKLGLLRAFAAKTAAEYCRRKGDAPAALVYAGLEPPAFSALFPAWEPQPEAAAANKADGRSPGLATPLKSLLDALAVRTHSIDALRRRPLPPGVDSARLEAFLHDADFQDLFGLTKDEFYAQPEWKQTRAKREAQLF